MSKSNKTDHKVRDPRDALTEVMRSGTRKLIAQAFEAEVAELLAAYAKQQNGKGPEVLVRNGSHPAREIQTGIGQVRRCRCRKSEVDKGNPVTFHPALVPPYVRKRPSLSAVLPWLYLFEGHLDGGDADGSGSQRWGLMQRGSLPAPSRG